MFLYTADGKLISLREQLVQSDHMRTNAYPYAYPYAHAHPRVVEHFEEFTSVKIPENLVKDFIDDKLWKEDLETHIDFIKGNNDSLKDRISSFLKLKDSIDKAQATLNTPPPVVQTVKPSDPMTPEEEAQFQQTQEQNKKAEEEKIEQAKNQLASMTKQKNETVTAGIKGIDKVLKSIQNTIKTIWKIRDNGQSYDYYMGILEQSITELKNALTATVQAIDNVLAQVQTLSEEVNTIDTRIADVYKKIDALEEMIQLEKKKTNDFNREQIKQTIEGYKADIKAQYDLEDELKATRKATVNKAYDLLDEKKNYDKFKAKVEKELAYRTEVYNKWVVYKEDSAFIKTESDGLGDIVSSICKNLPVLCETAKILLDTPQTNAKCLSNICKNAFCEETKAICPVK